MNNQHIKQHFLEAQSVLASFLDDERNMEAILAAGNLMVGALQKGGKILACGNGGSYCDAMHFTEELTGRYRENRKALPAILLGDGGHMTCVSNDYGFDYVFSRLIESLGNEDDVLLAISTSGNSENVLNAVKAAKEKGMHIVGLTGKDGGKLSSLVNVEIRAPHSQWADRAQEIHIKVIHALIDHIERSL